MFVNNTVNWVSEEPFLLAFGTSNNLHLFNDSFTDYFGFLIFLFPAIPQAIPHLIVCLSLRKTFSVSYKIIQYTRRILQDPVRFCKKGISCEILPNIRFFPRFL